MPDPFTFTGGARIGWTNATYPLARLSATPEKLTISIRILGTYSFAPDQVSEIERYTMIPVLGWGVRIHHCNPDCNPRVIFWCLGSPDTVLQGIRDAGFVPTAAKTDTSERRGMAVHWSVIILGIVLWNGLCILSWRSHGGVPMLPGPLILAPLILVFALCVGIPRSPTLQRFVLKPGRSVGEIRPFLQLLTFISAILLTVFSILVACGVFNNKP